MYSWWPRSDRPASDGLTVIIPAPEDLPFLLRLQLENFACIDTTVCHQILVVGDGCGSDGGAAIRRLVQQESLHDRRLAFVDFTWRDRLLLPIVRRDGSSVHWLMFVRSLGKANRAFALMHDADAFFLGHDALVKQHTKCSEGGLYALGMTARSDSFFAIIGYEIPATWELMISTSWIRSRSPYWIKGRRYKTPHGEHTFDTVLYPEYLDYPSGRIGLSDMSAEIAHFSATIVEYRRYCKTTGPFADYLFRILLLSILEELCPNDGCRVTPSVESLYSGLHDSSRRVHYRDDRATKGYAVFRNQMAVLEGALVMRGDRAKQLRSLLQPFDRHFVGLAREMGDQLGGPARKFRRSGLGVADA